MKKNKAPQASKLDKQKSASSQKVTVEQNDHHVNDLIHASLAASTQSAHLSKKLDKNLQPKADKASDHLPGDANATDLQDVYADIDKQLSDSDNMQFLAAASGDASASANATNNNKGDKDKVVITQDSGRGNHNYLLWLLGGGLLAGGVAAAASGGGGSSSPTPPPAPGKITDFNTFCDNAVTSGGLLTSLKTFNLNLTNVPSGNLSVSIDQGVTRPNAVTGISPTDFLNNTSYRMDTSGYLVGTEPGTTLKAAGLAVVLQNNLAFDSIDGINFNAHVDLITNLSSEDKVLWMHEMSIKTTADTGLTNEVDATLSVNAEAYNGSDAEIGICEVVIDVSGKTDAFASAEIDAYASQGASARVIIEDLEVKASVYNQGAATAYYGGTAEARLDSINASASQSAEAHVTVDSALVSAYLGEYGVGGEALANMGRETAEIIARAGTTGDDLSVIPTGSGISEASITIGNLDIRAESNAVSSEAKASMALGLGKDYFTSYTTTNTYTVTAYTGYVNNIFVTNYTGTGTNYFTNTNRFFDATLNIEAQSTGDQNYVATYADPIPGLTGYATDTIYIDQELNASVTIGNLDINATVNRGFSTAEASMASGGYNVQAKIFAHGTADEVNLTEVRSATIDIDNINITATAKMFAADAHAIIATSAYQNASFTIEAHADENSQTSITIGNLNVTATAGLPNATAYFDSFGAAVAGLAGNARDVIVEDDININIKALAHTSTSGAVPSADLTIGNINIEAHSQFTEGTANNHDLYSSKVYNSALAFMAANGDDTNVQIWADAEGDGADATVSINQINVIATAQSTATTSYATAFLIGNEDGSFSGSDSADLEFQARATDNSTASLTVQSIKVSASADHAQAYFIHNAEDASVDFDANASTGSSASLNIVGNIDIKATGANSAEAAMFASIDDAADFEVSASASGSSILTAYETLASVNIGNINIQATAEADSGYANAAIVTDVLQDDEEATDIEFDADADYGNASVTIGSVNVDATGYVAQAALISDVVVDNIDDDYDEGLVRVAIEASAGNDKTVARADIGTMHVSASGYVAQAGGIFDITGEDGETTAQLIIGAQAEDFGHADTEIDTFEVIAHAAGLSFTDTGEDFQFEAGARAMLVGSMSNDSNVDILSARVDIEANSNNKGQSTVDIGTLKVEAISNVEDNFVIFSNTKAFMAGEVHSSAYESAESLNNEGLLSASVNIGAEAVNLTNSPSPGRDTTSNVSIDDIEIKAVSNIGASIEDVNFNVASAFMAGGVTAGGTGYSGPFGNQDNLAGTASVDIHAASSGRSKATVDMGNIDIIADINQVSEGSSFFGEDGFVQSRAFMAGDARNNHVDIQATAYANFGASSGDQSDASVTIENINIKASSNAQGIGKIDAFVVGASGYDQNFADLTISAFNNAGSNSAANVDIGTLNVTASAEAGSTTLITDASLVNVGGFLGSGEDGSRGELTIGASNDGFQSTANVDITAINVNATANPSGSGYALFANANLVGADSAYALMGAGVSPWAKSAEASFHIEDIKVSAEGALINIAVGVQGQDHASLSIGAAESGLNNQATVTIGNIEVNASMPVDVANPYVSASNYFNIAALAAGQDANVNMVASSDGYNVGDISAPNPLASLSIDQIKVTADGSGYLNLAALQVGEEARGVIGAFADDNGGNAQVSIGSIEVEAIGGQIASAGLASGGLLGNGGLYAGQDLVATVEDDSSYQSGGSFSSAYLDIGSIHVHAETDVHSVAFQGGLGAAVAGFVSGAEYNEVNIEAFVSGYVTQAEASVNIDEITIHAVNNTQNNGDHGHDAHAGLAIGYAGATGYSGSNDNPTVSVDIQAEVTAYNAQQDVEASLDLGNIDIEATAKTGQANAAFALNAHYNFSSAEIGANNPDVTNPDAFDGENSYQAIAGVAIDASSDGYGDNAIADVTIGNISIEATSYSALNVNNDNYGPLTYGAGAGLAINAVVENNFDIVNIAPNVDITFNADQAFSATNGVVIGSLGANDGQASVTIDDITIKATSLENTALAAIAGNAYAASDVEIKVNRLGSAVAGNGGTSQSIDIDTTADANASSTMGARAYDNGSVSTDIKDIHITAISDSDDRAAIAGLALASRANNTMSVSSYARGISDGPSDENATANVDIQASAFANVSSYLGASADETSDASLTIQDINITATSNGDDGVALAAMAVSAEAFASADAFAYAIISGSEGEDSVSATARADADAEASVNAFIGAAAFDSGVAEVEIGHIDIEATGHYAIAAIGALANAEAYAEATAFFNADSAAASAYATVDVQIGAFATDQATANLDIASISLEATATTNGSHSGRAIAALAFAAHASADGNDVTNSYAEVGAGVYARAVGEDNDANVNVNVNIGYSEPEPIEPAVYSIAPSVGISLIADNLANGDASAFLAGSADDYVYGYISSYASDNGAANLAIGTLHIEATAANGDAVAAIAASASAVEAGIVARAIEDGHAELTIQGIHMEAKSVRIGDAIASLVANSDYSSAHFAAVALDAGEATLTINDGITMKADSDQGYAYAGMYNSALSKEISNGAVMQSLAVGSGAISELNIGGDIDISAHAKATATASISAIQAFADDGQANITLGGNVHIAATSTADDAFANASIQAIAIDGGVARINGNTEKDVSITANGHELARAELLIGAGVSDFTGDIGNDIASITLGDINVTSEVTAQRADSFSYALLGIAATVDEDSNGSATITAGDINVRAGAESGNTFAGLDVYASAYQSGSDYQHASFHLGDIAITNSATMTGYQDLSFAPSLGGSFGEDFGGNLDLQINNYDGNLSTVGNIEINLGANLTGYADIGADSSGDAHMIGFGNVEINLGLDSDMFMDVNQTYVTSTASRDLTITGASGADMELIISGDAVDDNAIPGATASYGFTNINLDNYSGSFDLVVNDAGNVVVDGSVRGITFGTGIAGNIYDGRDLGISHLTISGFDSQDTITFDFDNTINDINVDSDTRNNFTDISDGPASTNLRNFWSGIQSAMLSLDNEAPGGFVYDEFNESGANIDINGDGDSTDSNIGVLAYGNTSDTGGITSVIFLENPLTHILASQIYADSYNLV
jgi:hypothetical protein